MHIMVDAADVGMVALTVTMLVLVAVGVDRSARRAGFPANETKRLAVRVGGMVVVWLAFTALLARTGVLSNWAARPPRWPLLPLTAFATMLLSSRTATAKRLLGSMPGVWPIAAQSCRGARARGLVARLGLALPELDLDAYVEDEIVRLGAFPVYPGVAEPLGLDGSLVFLRPAVGRAMPVPIRLRPFVQGSFASYRETPRARLVSPRVQEWLENERLVAELGRMAAG